MAIARVEVITHPRATDPPKDYTVNVLHFSGGVSGSDPYQNLADGVSAVWKRGTLVPAEWGPFDNRNHEIKVYDLSDAKPRPIKGHTVYTSGFPTSGPIMTRQVCLVLSFYADRNLPSRRGRIYVGPFEPEGSSTTERPSDNEMNRLLDLGARLNGITLGGGSWAHGIYSHKLGDFHGAGTYWVNDVWDTQRRRAPKETKRFKRTIQALVDALTITVSVGTVFLLVVGAVLLVRYQRRADDHPTPPEGTRRNPPEDASDGR